MKKNKKLIGYIAVAVLCAGTLLYILKYITDAPYRNQLPAVPNAGALPTPLQEQIMNAHKKAVAFTTAGTLGDLGMIYNSCGDYERASACYQLAIKKNAEQWLWNYYLGYLSLQQGQSGDAITNFKQVIEKNPANRFALYYEGEVYRALNSNDSAAIIFQELIHAPDTLEATTIKRTSFFPLKTYARFQLARVYTSMGKQDSAKALLKVLIKEQGTFGPAYRALAALYLASGDSALANNFSVRSNDLTDYVPPADKLLDDIALLSRSDQFLVKEVEDAVRSGNYHWALTLCEHALKYFPDNKTFISNAVFENLREGLDDKALPYLGKHFSYFNNDAKELMDMTDILYNKQHLTEALQYFNQVKKLMPRNSTLAIWLFERGKKDEGIAMMTELIKQNPADNNILSDQVRMLISLGNDDLANEYLSRLQQRAPTNALTFQLTGLMAEKKGNIDSAAISYEGAYKTDPKDMIFTRTLIEFYIRQKKWNEAIGHFRSALALNPNEPFLLEGLGRLLIACPDTALKNVSEGIQYSERAFISYRSSYQTKLSAGKDLATAYLSLQDKKNATIYMNKTVLLAREGNQSEETVAYFKALIGR